jgi:hypothetical protein
VRKEMIAAYMMDVNLRTGTLEVVVKSEEAERAMPSFYP